MTDYAKYAAARIARAADRPPASKIFPAGIATQ